VPKRHKFTETIGSWLSEAAERRNGEPLLMGTVSVLHVLLEIDPTITQL
jgi:hypothetical protein